MTGGFSGGWTRRRVVAVVAAAWLIALVAPLVASAHTQSTPVPPNCAPARPAIAFQAGTQTLLRPQPGAPIPCGSSTGYPAVESRIAASPAGVVYDPATYGSTTGVAYLTAQSATWKVTGSNAGIDDNLYVDPRTGRLFRETFQPDPANADNHQVAFSDDGGQHWTVSSTGGCCAEGENSRIVTDEPIAAGPKPTGTYPDVVYLCSDTSLLGGVEPAAGGRVCSRSLDGGLTFSTPSLLFSKPVPQHPDCAPYGGEYFAASEGAYPEAGPNGRLYVLVHCGTDHVAVTYLGYSDDEAATWHLVPASACKAGAAGPLVIPDAQELRVDGRGDLYAAWTHTIASPYPAIVHDDEPVLQASTNGGCTWTQPVAVTPPGVVAHSHHPEDDAFSSGQKAPYWPEYLTDYSWFIDVTPGGQVALDFYGTKDPTGAHWDAYIVESLNAIGPNPVFWAATVNPPTTNMRNGAYADENSSGNEHNGLSLSSDGSPWGSFTDGTDGFAGRLYWPKR